MNYNNLKELKANISRDTLIENPTLGSVNGILLPDSHMATDANTPKPSKYHNQRTNGYPSKKHAQYAAELELRRAAGEVWFWLEEVAFKLPGGVKHRVDFMVFYHCHIESYKAAGQEFAFMKNWELVEIKGRDLPMGKLKRKQVEDIYHVEIRVI